MKLVGVPIKDVEAVWPEVETIVNSTLQRFGDDRFTTDDVKRDILAGNMQLWTDDYRLGVCITQVLVYPRHKELLVWLVAVADGFKQEEHADLFEQICQGAATIGCKRVRAYARPGFERVLAGWKKQRVEIVKEL